MKSLFARQDVRALGLVLTLLGREAYIVKTVVDFGVKVSELVPSHWRAWTVRLQPTLHAGQVAVVSVADGRLLIFFLILMPGIEIGQHRVQTSPCQSA